MQLILSYCSLTKCSSLRTSNSFVVSVVNASSKTKLISETFGGAVFKLFQKNKVWFWWWWWWIHGGGGEGAGIQGFHLKFSTLFSILSWFSWSGQSSWSCLVPANDWARKLAQEKFVSVIKSRIPLILSPWRHSSFQILTAFFLYLLQFRAGYFGRCGGMWGGSGLRWG